MTMYTEQNKGFTVITNFGCDRNKKKGSGL